MAIYQVKKIYYLTIILIITATSVFAQSDKVIRDSANTVLIKAGNYNKSSFYKFFWGEHYRKEWNTPVVAKKVLLDTIHGGLNVYQLGGSRQTTSIRATDKNEREYAFRSVDKSFGGALPEITLGTFIEKLANDQVTFSHPYSALVVAPLAEAARIYHANPELVFVPKQDALGKYNDSAGNVLYTLEQRPDENWETASNFGNSKKIVGTEKMFEKILEDNDNSVHQKAFVRARLFDMWIGDWGRHDDQWRWASFKDDKKTLYVPIPRDRDNAFTKFDGLLLKVLIPAAKARHLQTFDNNIKNVNQFNFPARHLDHRLMNEVTLDEWINIAKELQTNLTDAVIDNAVTKMPAEVYRFSGTEIAGKLKARRGELVNWANTYYKFLTEDVEITGTEKRELFEVIRVNDSETEVNIYKINKEGETKNKPIYHRIFKTSETNEIRLYGIKGNDEYKVTGKVNKGIKVRLIGGTDKDSYNDESIVKGPSHKTKIYDNPGNEIISKTSETEIKLSSDSLINNYNYKYFKYNKTGKVPLLFFNNDDRFFVGLGYTTQKNKWRKQDFANIQYVDVKYSISQKGFSSTYKSTFLQLLGNWNLNNYVNYDQIRWTNFYGLGNETKLTTKERDFNRTRSEEFITSVTTDRVFNNRHKFITGVSFNTFRILNDTGRFLIKQSGLNPQLKSINESFGSALFGYIFQHVNDSVLPTKGISFQIEGSFIDNLKTKTNNVGRFGASTNFYIPLGKKLSMFTRFGGSTLTGTPQFFQYNRLGGSNTLRGYQRDRFHANSTAFSQNEIRYIKNVKSFLYNGKFGVFGLFDAGRVWLKGQKSDAIYSAYGGGVILSPFNRLSVAVAYAKSPEDTNIHISLLKPF